MQVVAHALVISGFLLDVSHNNSLYHHVDCIKHLREKEIWWN
jgi:hypothetical protein